MSFASEPQLAPGRSCAGCTLCCKLVRVDELNKPRLIMCHYCEVGRGCKVFGKPERPSDCATYYCDYRRNASLPEIWRPAHSHMVMSFDPETLRVDVLVDPDYPDVWRRQPFYEQIKVIAQNALRGLGYLIVWQGREAIAVLPDRDVSLGPVQKDVIVVTQTQTPEGMTYDARLMAPDDPLRKQMPA